MDKLSDTILMNLNTFLIAVITCPVAMVAD